MFDKGVRKLLRRKTMERERPEKTEVFFIVAVVVVVVVVAAAAVAIFLQKNPYIPKAANIIKTTSNIMVDYMGGCVDPVP